MEICYKNDFPLLKNKDIAYLDSAATAQRPKCVLEAFKEYYENYNANPLRGFYDLGVSATKKLEESRETVRKFINAKSIKEIIFTRNATESINLVAYSYGLNNLKKGDEILITIAEHHSNILPWQMVAKKTGATLKYLDCEEDGSYSFDKINKAVTKNTKIASINHISNVLGSFGPVNEIINLVHKNKGIVLVDGAQSAPHIPVDVVNLDCDFFVFSGHKLMAPMGIGVLYGKEEILEKMPPFLTGGEMIDYVTKDTATFSELPHKFEAGTVNGGGAYGLMSAINYIESIGFKNIRKIEDELTKYALLKMSEIPHVKILGSKDYKNHNGIISFIIEGVHPHDIAAILNSDNIAIRAGHHCAQPLLKYLKVSSCVRASLYFYNTIDDVERLISSIRTIRRKMGYGE